jgi:hypothetical protein
MHKLITAILFILISFSACNKKPSASTSFYYWKTSYALNNFEKKYLQDNHVQNIYMRCFDVIPSAKLYEPNAVLIWKDAPEKNINYIPVVFITNAIFENVDSSEVSSMVNNIFQLTQQIFASQNLSILEMQIDCDWTTSTKDIYFYFLELLAKKKIIVSNTLRLYQYKYRKDAGIAPTNYASLMCYNMGNLKSANTENSIINLKDLQAYTNQVTDYPKPINIAMPLFDWVLVYKKNAFKNILYSCPNTSTSNWKKIKENQFICIRNYLDTCCNQYFYNAETIRIEQISKQDWLQAKQYIQQHLSNTKNEIIYYTLDSAQIQNYLF